MSMNSLWAWILQYNVPINSVLLSKPLSTFKEVMEINPETDWVPLCANCHRMVHRRKDDVLSVDELKELIIRHSEWNNKWATHEATGGQRAVLWSDVDFILLSKVRSCHNVFCDLWVECISGIGRAHFHILR